MSDSLAKGEPTIVRGSDHFFTIKYEGNGREQRIGKHVPFTDSGTIAKSCMFNDGSNNYLTRTQGSGSGDQKRKATFSWWFKRGIIPNAEICMFGAASGTKLMARYDTSNRMTLRLTNGGTEYQKITSRSFEDCTQWYHCVWQIDASQSTATDRSKLYVNGERVYNWSSDSNPAQNTDIVGLADGSTFRIGSNSHAVGQIWDGYMAEFNYIDGSVVDPDEFGVVDSSTGQWIPKTITGLTYGSEGLRITFANTAGLTIGDDTSGNSNDLTATNIGTDHITTDSPTQNHCVMDSTVSVGSPAFSEGNKTLTAPSSEYGKCLGTLEFNPKTQTGFYWEVSFGAASNGPEMGIMKEGFLPTDPGGSGNASDLGAINLTAAGAGESNHYVIDKDDSKESSGRGLLINTGVDVDDSHRIGIAVKDGKIWFAVNNTWVESGNPSTGANPAVKDIGSDGHDLVKPYFGTYNSGTITCHFVESEWNYSPPTGFVALNQDNLDTENTRGRVGLTWIKNVDVSSHPIITDTVMSEVSSGNADYGDAIFPTLNQARSFQTSGLRKPMKGGLQVLDGSAVNGSGETHCAWNWVGNNQTRTANADGSGATTASAIEVNDTAGFSMVHYVGAGTSDKKIAHGLSKAPETIWLKNIVENSSTGSGVDWRIYHHNVYNVSSDRNSYFRFNSDDSHTASGDTFGDTAPTNKVFTVGNDVHSNASVSGGTAQYMAYCWYGVPGYSKFGFYEGNGSSQGPFVNLGFKPAWLLIKGINIGNNWILWDNQRSPFNERDKVYYPDLQQAQTTSGNDMDFLANGFKCRGTNSNYNGSYKYAYWAFAEHPFIGDGTNPCTAV